MDAELKYIKQPTNKICYMILPKGIKENLTAELAKLSEKHGVSMVVIEDVNWNDDLTPWPAEGVFKKAKPFRGQATAFLDKLTRELISKAEESMAVEVTERTFFMPLR